jgi:hypothetical protein
MSRLTKIWNLGKNALSSAGRVTETAALSRVGSNPKAFSMISGLDMRVPGRKFDLAVGRGTVGETTGRVLNAAKLPAAGAGVVHAGQTLGEGYEALDSGYQDTITSAVGHGLISPETGQDYKNRNPITTLGKAWWNSRNVSDEDLADSMSRGIDGRGMREQDVERVLGTAARDIMPGRIAKGAKNILEKRETESPLDSFVRKGRLGLTLPTAWATEAAVQGAAATNQDLVPRTKNFERLLDIAKHRVLPDRGEGSTQIPLPRQVGGGHVSIDDPRGFIEDLRASPGIIEEGRDLADFAGRITTTGELPSGEDLIRGLGERVRSEIGSAKWGAAKSLALGIAKQALVGDGTKKGNKTMSADVAGQDFSGPFEAFRKQLRSTYGGGGEG